MLHDVKPNHCVLSTDYQKKLKIDHEHVVEGHVLRDLNREIV